MSDRPAAGPADGTVAPTRPMEERRRHALRDLEEVEEQLAAGELDEETAARLRAGYEAELQSLESAPARAAEDSTPVGSRRALIGALLIIGAFTAVILAASQVFRSDDPSGAAGGGVDVARTDTAGIDELEEIVASHPDSPGMALALADAYFEQGDFSSALGHYLDVLEKQPAPLEEGRALGRIGWMAYLTGQVDASSSYLTASLESDPGNAENKLYLAMVRYEGQGDAAGAIPLLEDVLEVPNLPDPMRGVVQGVLDEARTSLENP